jgi:MFS transporter, Spinster family, sphingosine-1-phosphate transporter
MRGARLALALLLLINLFNYIDRQVLAAVTPFLKTTFFGSGATHPALEWFEQHVGFKPENALLGVLQMAFMVFYMVAAPLFARLAERCSRWTIIGIGVAVWSMASAASGLAGSFTALLLTRCFVGIGEAAYGPVAPALISDLYPVKMRGQVLSWFYVAIPVGSALGYVLGDRVSQALDWRWAFYVVMPPGLLLALWSFWMRARHEPKRGEADRVAVATPKESRWNDYLVLFRTPSYVYCSLGMAAMTFAIGGIGFWMPTYLAGRPGSGAAATTVFGALTVIAGLTATLLGGLTGDWLRGRLPGSYFVVSGVAMFAGFPFLLAMLWMPFPWAWICLFLAVFCLFFNTGPTNTILANVTHPAVRAVGFAVNIFIIHALGDVPSPVIMGLISDRFDMDTAFLVVGAMFVVSGAVWLAGARYLAKDTELAPTRIALVRNLR